MKKKWIANPDWVRSILLRIISLSALISVNLISPPDVRAEKIRIVSPVLHLKGTGITVREALVQLESQSSYTFMYNDNKVDLARKVNLNLRNTDMDNALQALFSGTSTKYTVKNNHIVLYDDADAPTVVQQKVQQQLTVRGKVTDNRGTTIPSVTVMVKNTTNGVVSDANGSYVLTNVPSDGVIKFSFMGMKTLEIAVNGRTRIDAEMEESSVRVDEVVVTALGIKKEAKALGYAVSEVKGNELSTAKELNVMNSLSGRVSGVDIASTISGPSGSTRILIRGNSQLSGSNQPLFVVDGVPIDNSQLGSASKWGGYDFGDGLSSINPDDIASVSILKGASASALYGSRASNGVVLITTKSADKKGIGVEVSSSINAVTMLTRFDDYQTIYGQGRSGELPLTVEASRSAATSAWGPKLDPNLSIPIFNGSIKPYGVQNNNILGFFKTGMTLNNSVSFTSSTEKTNLRLSASNMTNTDIIPNSDMSRSSFMVKGDARLSKLISVETRVNYTFEKVHNRPALSDSPNNVGLSLIGIPANFNQAWLGESYKDTYGKYNDWNGNNIYRINPYWSINEMSNDSRKRRVMGYMQVKLDFTKDLSFHVKGGTDFYTFGMTDYSPVSTPVAPGGRMSETSFNVSETNAEAMLRYSKKFFEKLDLSAFVGGNVMYSRSETMGVEGKNEVIPDIKYIGNYTIKEVSYGFSEKQVNSLYASVSLGYNNLAYLDFTLRNDWSSTLSKGHNSYRYPSLSGSFIFSELIEDKSVLSFGKVRASVAQVGGDTDPYRLSLNYGLLPTSFKGIPLGVISSGEIPKKDLKPTRTNSWEVGADIRFFNNRIGIDAAYYSQSTKDQILSLPITVTTGYNSAVVNAGEITNKGVELTLSTKPIMTPSVSWDVNFTYSKNVNKVVRLHSQVKDYVLAEATWAGALVEAIEGNAYGVIVGKKLQRDPNGNVIFGSNGMPLFGDKLEVLGNGTFDWIGGVNSSLSYKGFTLGCLFDIKMGADIYSMSNMFSHINGTSKNTLEGREEWYISEEKRKAAGVDPQAWTPTGGYVGKGVVNVGTEQNPKYVANTKPVDPQAYWNAFYNGSPEPFIYDASFVKLREMTLTYSFSSKLLRNTFLTGASLSVYGRNLWIIYTNLDNIDPESNYNNGNGQGLEYGSTPSRRSFGATLNLKF